VYSTFLFFFFPRLFIWSSSSLLLLLGRQGVDGDLLS